MPTQLIEFEAPSGLALTVTLHADASDVAAYTASAVAEETNRKSWYRATFSGIAAGNYQLNAKFGSTGVANWWGYAEDTDSTFVFGERVDRLGSEVLSEITADVHESSGVVLKTTAASIVSTRKLTLTAGSADDDAYNGCLVVLRDQATATQKDVLEITDYVGSTKEVTFAQDPVFTPTAGDSITVLADRSSIVVVSIPEQAVPPPSPAGTRLYAFVGETKLQTLQGLDSDYSAVELVLKIKDRYGVEILSLADADLTKTPTSIAFTIPKEYLTQRAEWNWSIRLADSTNLVQLWGPFVVLYAA